MGDWYTEEVLRVIAIGIVIGLALGVLMQRASKIRLPVRGGAAAEVFHYLASSTFAALIPVIFIAIFSGLHFGRVSLSGITFSISTWVFLFLYGYFESQVAVTETGPKIELD